MCAARQGFQGKDSNALSLPSNTASKHPDQTRVPAQLAYLGEEDYQSFRNPSGRSQEAVSLGSHCCFYYSSAFSLDNAPTHMQSGEMCGAQS